MSDQMKEEMARIKERFFKEKEKSGSIAERIAESIVSDFKPNLWEFSESELDREMSSRLSALNDDIDCRPSHRITSHRKMIGPLIVFFKRMVRKLTAPYINMLLEKQKKFNEDLVTFHLATFIRLKQIDKRLTQLEQSLRELEHQTVSQDGKPD